MQIEWRESEESSGRAVAQVGEGSIIMQWIAKSLNDFWSLCFSLSLSKFLRLFMDCIFHVRSSQEKNKKNDTPLSINRFLSLNSYDFSQRTLLHCQKRSNRNPLTFRSGAHFFLPIIYSRGPRHWDYLSNSMSKIFWHISIFLSWIVCFSHACLSLEK